MIRALSALMSLVLTSTATSVYPQDHICPVCSAKSVTMSLASHSHFGEFARDLSDVPAFQFDQVEVCPTDLYASWSSRWDEIDKREKAKLAEFLKRPSITLSPDERRIVAGHEAELRASRWWRLLWVRSCDDVRGITARQRHNTTMLFHYAGRYDQADWNNQLSSHYREKAILSLKEAVTAEWTTPSEKRIFSYLRAELVRQAGRLQEASELFREVIANEKKAPASEELAWIPRWAEEQSLKADPKATNAEALVALILPGMPDPWRAEKASALPGWPRHLAALQILSERASQGDAPAAKALWKILERKPERLLALVETVGTDLKPLRTTDPKWKSWFDEISARLKGEKLPAPFEADPNPQRLVNVFTGRILEEPGGRAWRQSVLQPAIIKALAGHDLPSVTLPQDDPIEGTSLPPLISPDRTLKTGEVPPQVAAPPPPTSPKLALALIELLQEQPRDQQPATARMLMRLLQKAEEAPEDAAYPNNRIVTQLLELNGMDRELARELDAPWKSTFWKTMGEYIARVPASSEKLASHPLVSKAFGESEDRPYERLLWDAFAERDDRIWNDRLVPELEKPGRPPFDYSYAFKLNDPKVDAALEQRLRLLRGRAKKDDPAEMIYYELRTIEGLKVTRSLKPIPIQEGR